MRAASRSLGLGLCLIALGCAAEKPREAMVGSTIGDNYAGTLGGAGGSLNVDADDAGAAGQVETEAESAPPVVDPEVSRALLAKSGESAGPAPLGLRFEVLEQGAELPWAFAVVNRGTEAALVDFDARLLTLEIRLPPEPQKTDAKGKLIPNRKKAPKPVVCRLPADVVPRSVDPALARKLEPGEGMVQQFDPRLYCIGKAPWPLVEGAEVSARFGWTPKMKVTWKGGKREEKPGAQNEPFVAEPSEAEGSLPENGGVEAGERRIKELVGTPLTLGASFATVPKSANEPEPGLEITLTGSDASSEATATATTVITNRGKRKQDLYFRRELVTYEVSGPDGVFQCDAKPDTRAPTDRSAVTTLRPGGKFSAVTRLIEMCPARSLARPGLYLVHARFDAADPGNDLGFQAFMGRLVSKKPALVRIRQGELPFTPAAGAMRVRVGE